MRIPIEDWTTPEKLAVIKGLAISGATDEQIAKKIGINRSTLQTWRKKAPEIEKAMRAGKEDADMEALTAFQKTVLGYYVEEEDMTVTEHRDGTQTKVKHKKRRWIPPQPSTQIFWLKNRLAWRDAVENTATTIDDDGFIEALNEKANEVWNETE